MFILNKVQYLLWVSFPSKIKRTNLYRRGQPINNTGCLLLSECFFQHCFSIADPALRNIILCDCYLVKLFYYLLFSFRFYLLHGWYFSTKFFSFFVTSLFIDFFLHVNAHAYS